MNEENKTKTDSKNIVGKLFSVGNILIASLPAILLLGILRDPTVLGNEGILIGAIIVPVFVYLAGILREKFGVLKALIFVWVGAIALFFVVVMTLANFVNIDTSSNQGQQRSIAEWEVSPYYEECLSIAANYYERNDEDLFKDEVSFDISKQSVQVLIRCIEEKENSILNRLVTHVINYVDVKYRNDPVDVSNFEYLNTSRSSWVRGAWYDAANQYMIINLQGTNYHYCDMPSSAWRSFKSTSSSGNHYNAYIKSSYDCQYNYLSHY